MRSFVAALIFSLSAFAPQFAHAAQPDWAIAAEAVDGSDVWYVDTRTVTTYANGLTGAILKQEHPSGGYLVHLVAFNCQRGTYEFVRSYASDGTSDETPSGWSWLTHGSVIRIVASHVCGGQ